MTRTTTHAINNVFLERWSPRSLTGEEISDADLMSLFEAARWAPSAFNEQPWRFFYAKKGSEHWDKFFDVMVEFNQSWAKDASVLVLLVSTKTFVRNDKDNRHHSFDTGAAWMSLALQAQMRGYVTHAMAGIDFEAAHKMLNLSDKFHVEAMIAIGKQGPKEALPEAMQQREAPSDRKPLDEIALAGPLE